MTNFIKRTLAFLLVMLMFAGCARQPEIITNVKHEKVEVKVPTKVTVKRPKLCSDFSGKYFEPVEKLRACKDELWEILKKSVNFED